MSKQIPPFARPDRQNHASFRTIWLVAWLLVALAFCFVPIATGAQAFLLFELPDGLPLGTLFAALTLILDSAVSVAASQPRSLLRLVSSGTVVAASLWLPIGIWLAKNPALNFVNDAADSAAFWRFTHGLAWLIVATMLWAGAEAINRLRFAPVHAIDHEWSLNYGPALSVLQGRRLLPSLCSIIRHN
jgi:hypothetical protein